MYKGVELPSEYNNLTLPQKEAIWLGMLLIYEDDSYFDECYWVDEIVNASEVIIFEDDIINLYKCYNDLYKIHYKQLNKSMVSSFDYFFMPNEDCKYADMGKMLGGKYKGVFVRDYIRSKDFPITSEFWQ